MKRRWKITESNTNRHSMMKKNCWDRNFIVGEEMEENRIKHKQTEHDKKNSWDGKLTNESGGEEKYSQTQTERAY